MFDLCYGCEKNEHLGKTHICPVDSLRETYQHVSIKLGYFNIERLLGKKLSMHYTNIQPEDANRIVAYIESKAAGNITLALLYLEDIFTQDEVSTFSMDRVDDRLPRDVIAYFDTEMKFIERKPKPQRLPPLLAIAAAADHHDGIPFKELGRCIRLAQNTCSNLDYPRSVEDVFSAGNGWLIDPLTDDQRVDICCRPTFPLYVTQKYNDSLEWARRQIESTAKGRPGAVIPQPFEEISSPVETPDLIGGTFDTLASERPPPTPLMSFEDGLRIRELDGTFDRAIFLSKDEKLVQSPPRLDSTEYVPRMAQGIVPVHKPERIFTQPDTVPTQPQIRVCEFCVRNVLESGASSGQHRISMDDLSSVLNQCTFCTSLYGSITKAKGPYCTLSHAWGPREKPFLTTTVWNMAKHLITGISLHELPLNFQHAIRVTRFLKVRYIWIDSLAILQEPFGDFAREANLMHKVYRYSHCNIVAADSEDAYGGLFRGRTPHEILPVKYHGTNASHHLGTKTWTIVPADLWEKELLNSIIYYRAWVFQGDKTIAIWSIAKLLRDVMREQYAVGMWSEALEEQMAWRVRENQKCENMPELDASIPSWSWASVRGSIVPQHRLALRSYTVTDHDGAMVKFTVDKETREGDKEPTLERKALELRTHISFGRLISVEEDVYRLQVLGKAFSGPIEMDAFPDAPLSTTAIDPQQCAFMILAASVTSNNTSGLQLGIPSSSETCQTYSGIGLLLIAHSAWFSNQEKLHHEYKSALSGLKPSREQEWRLDAFSKLMSQQSERIMNMKGNIASVYRRIGALQFRDIDEQAFKSLTNDQNLENIWLE
ncbi:unnamed protein product [Alternaria alternata]